MNTKFNPADLASAPASEELIREEQDQGTADFIARCKAKGVEGEMSLIASAGSTLAIIIDRQLMQIVTGQDYAQVRALWKELDSRNQVMAMMLAFSGAHHGLKALLTKNANEIPDPLQRAYMIRDLEECSRIATTLAESMGPEICKSQLQMAEMAKSGDGARSVRTATGSLHMRREVRRND